MKVTIPYTPRKQQAFIHDQIEKFRYSLLCCHRRFGKTVMCINHLIKEAMMNKHHNPRYAYIAPTYGQAKKIAFDYLKYYTKEIPGTKYNTLGRSCNDNESIISCNVLPSKKSLNTSSALERVIV